MKALITLILAGSFLATPGMAQDESEDVIAAVTEFYTRLNEADPTYVNFWHPEATAYTRAGGLLGIEVGLRDESAVRAAFDRGLEYNVTVRNLEAKVFNGDTAIATYYTGGTVRNPEVGGGVQGGSFRGTMVWSKIDGNWRIVHMHISPLG